MSSPLHNPRTPEYEVDALFTDRWSPRAYLPEPVSDAQIRALFEAARWAPSSSNEQPWLFLYARSEEDRRRFASALVEWNQRWATQAPLLIYVLVRLHTRKGNRNATAAFDAGAAWMSLALQARRLGLHAHAMGGFEREKAIQVLGVPEDRYDVIAAVAVGRRGDPASLPAEMAEREFPNDRKPHAEVAAEGGFPSP